MVQLRSAPSVKNVPGRRELRPAKGPRRASSGRVLERKPVLKLPQTLEVYTVRKPAACLGPFVALPTVVLFTSPATGLGDALSARPLPTGRQDAARRPRERYGWPDRLALAGHHAT